MDSGNSDIKIENTGKEFGSMRLQKIAKLPFPIEIAFSIFNPKVLGKVHLEALVVQPATTHMRLSHNRVLSAKYTQLCCNPIIADLQYV
jgi:hypothetical protein